MPYASVSEVPKSVPKDNRKQWLEIWNSIYAARIKAGDSKEEAERRAFAGANSKAGPNSKTALAIDLLKLGALVIDGGMING